MKKTARWCEVQETTAQPPQQIIKIDTSSLMNNTEMVSDTIKVVDNTVFFYCDVSVSSAAELNRILTELELKLLHTKNLLDDGYSPSIKLRINSYGGSLLDGFSIVDRIRTLRVPVHTYIDGGAASAATLISIVGSKRFIGRHSWMLIHQLSAMYVGNFQQLDDEHSNSKRLMEVIKSIYKKYTKIPLKNLDGILKHDIWFDAEECLKFGLVDEIL